MTKSLKTGEIMKNGKHAHFHQDLCPCKAHPEANKMGGNQERIIKKGENQEQININGGKTRKTVKMHIFIRICAPARLIRRRTNGGKSGTNQ